MENGHTAKENIYFNGEGNAVPVMEPDIYFDEKEDFSSPEKREKVLLKNIGERNQEEYYSYENALFLLSCLEKLLFLVRSGKELKILRMRLNGMSYREIGTSLHIGLASINRFVKRIALRNPQVGFLLEHASVITKKRDS